MTIAEGKRTLLAWLNSQVGTREGANNWNPYAENPDVAKLLGWKAQNQPWCDLFTDAAFVACFGLEKASRMTYQPIGKGSAACRTSAKYFRDKGAWSQTPQVCAVIFFYSGGDINHQGIVTAVEGETVITVEGNSSDMVAKRSYPIGDARIAGYGIPNWAALEDDGAEETEEKQEAESPQPAFRIPQERYHKARYKVTLPLLVEGNAGPLVHALQALLNSRGFTCEESGFFDGKTRKALLDFQRAAGILADGECGGQTWTALLNWRV